MVRKHKRSFDLFSSYGYWTPNYKGIFFLLLFLGAGVCIASFISLLIGKVCGPDFNLKFGLLISYPIQFIPAMLFASIMSHKNEGFDTVPNELDSSRFSPVGGLGAAILGVAGTLALAIVVEPVMTVLPEMPQKLKDIIERLAGGPVWVALLSTAVFAPLFEEWLCRGMIMRGLLARTSPATAIIISAAIFAIMHANPWQAIPAFVIGCFFGLVYWKTGSLKTTMLMHCFNNATSVLITQIPAIQDTDFIYQAFSGHIGLYCIFYAVCLVIVALTTLKFIRTDFYD